MLRGSTRARMRQSSKTAKRLYGLDVPWGADGRWTSPVDGCMKGHDCRIIRKSLDRRKCATQNRIRRRVRDRLGYLGDAVRYLYGLARPFLRPNETSKAAHTGPTDPDAR